MSPSRRSPPRSLAPAHRALGVSALAAVAASAAFAISPPAPAVAATIDTPNACRYSVDDGWREHRMPLTGTITAIAGDADRDPTAAAPGEAISLRITPSAPALLPPWLAQEGYERGIFRAGVNEFPVELWFAFEGSNTVEGTQVHRVQATGRLVIRTNPDGSFRDSTDPDDRFRLEGLEPIDTTWTAKGGRVSFRQATGDGLARAGARIPGVGDRTYAPVGSIVARMEGIAGEDTSVLIDCEPGETVEGDGELNEGRRRHQAKPFAEVSVPGAVCIDRFGQSRLDREVSGRGVELRRDGAALSATPGVPLTLDGTRLEVELPREDVLEMYRQEGPSATLIAAAGRREYPLTGRVAVRASGTREGVQSVALDGRWAIAVDQPAGTTDRRDPGVRLLDPDDPSREQADPVRLVVTLPGTTWTPDGSGPVAFSLAGPGSAGAVAVVDRGVLPGGRDDAFTIQPYGALLLRQGTDREGLDLDCLNGTIAVAGNVAYSTRGDLPASQGGSTGRYAIAERATDPFFVAPLVAAGELPTPDPGPAVPPPLGGGGFAAPPTKAPGTGSMPTRLRVASTRLRATSKRTRVRVRVTNPRRTAERVTVRIRTADRVTLGKTRTRRTIATSSSLRLAAGRSRTVRLRLTADARRLLASRSSLRVRVTVTPRSGPAATRVVRLAR